MDKNMKILVVDDFASMRRTVRTILKEIGFVNISEAEDGVRALAQLKSDKFEVLITDWNMPSMDGITLVRMIRGDAELKDMIVFMVTAEAEADHVLEAIKMGINDYIVKPFTAEVLQKKLEKVFLAKHAT
ncbi:MAG: response regulator [Nitrospirae bacterium]|nr:response regulator [Nitrospirota bacterium]